MYNVFVDDGTDGHYSFSSYEDAIVFVDAQQTLGYLVHTDF